MRQGTIARKDAAFLTAADARRMEAAEEYGALRYAQAVQVLNPEWNSTWEEFHGGHIVFVARRSMVGRAHGLGFAGPITPQDIEYIEKFYFDREYHAQVDVCPYAHPSLFESLNQRRFQVAEFNQTLARWIQPQEQFESLEHFAKPSIEGLEIRAVRSGEAPAWSRMLAHVFMGEHAPQFEKFFEPWASGAHPLTLAAFANGKMIAGCGGLIVPEHKMAGFFGAATLPEYRRRGLQSAFMQERLRITQQAGCDLAVTLTMPGTTSQRNVERAGFRTAYTKVVVTKKHPTNIESAPATVSYSE
jgi:GNAT superfamily N-acetyltransferase